MAGALLAAALCFAATGLVRLNTWYLASDQFAFLTAAHDLRSGALLHDASGLQAIHPLARVGVTYDALAQTHFLRDGRLWSRYPPGFPALLAMAGALFGEVGEHALNPLLYLCLLYTSPSPRDQRGSRMPSSA